MSFRVPADESGPGRARRLIREHIPSPVRDDVLLALSELVTNAVKHGVNPSGDVVVNLSRSGDMLRVEVTDEGIDSSFGAGAFEEPAASGGVGLRLVAKIASRFGVERDRQTTVWFEVPATA